MSWAEDLWDEHESLSTYSEIGLRCLEEYGKFLKEQFDPTNFNSAVFISIKFPFRAKAAIYKTGFLYQ